MQENMGENDRNGHWETCFRKHSPEGSPEQELDIQTSEKGSRGLVSASKRKQEGKGVAKDCLPRNTDVIWVGRLLALGFRHSGAEMEVDTIWSVAFSSGKKTGGNVNVGVPSHQRSPEQILLATVSKPVRSCNRPPIGSLSVSFVFMPGSPTSPADPRCCLETRFPFPLADTAKVKRTPV
ncbi:hypothetical protein STEG23_016786 [Scotinomys teguina]